VPIQVPCERLSPDRETNWLPAPAGGFRPILNMYQPGEGVFDGSWLPAPDGPFYLVRRIYCPEKAALDGIWTPPPIRRVD